MAGSSRQGIVRRLECLFEPGPGDRLAGRIRSRVSWNVIYRMVSYTRSSLWIVPIIAIFLEFIAVRFFHALDAWIVYPFEGLGLHGAETLLQTIITMTLSFLVFTFGSLLVAIQVASGQLTPRIIATTLLRNNVVRYSVGLFVFSMMFAVSTLGRIEEQVHKIPLFFAATLGLLCIADFLYLIDYASRLLRPVSIAGRVGEMGIRVIESVYPRPTQGRIPAKNRDMGPPRRAVFHRGAGQIVVALNMRSLVMEAKAAGGVIAFMHRVGDFVGTGEPLFSLYAGAAAIDGRTLQAAVAFGPERTLEQDPTFAFRILADIGLKALSPAINDPTTAVLVLDQLQRLLRAVGLRHLHDDEVPDDMGQLRLILRTPNWDDFVHLSFTEIRHNGAGNIQIARRLRAMIENLMGTLPEHRHPALGMQLELLNSSIERRYKLAEDLELARIADTQGL